jgi:N-acetylmuramoyl-L-alanine amidase
MQISVTQDNGTLWIRTQKKTMQEALITNKKKIVLDPGHGGIDPGAIGNNGAYEKMIVLSLAKVVKSILEKNDFVVYLTRENDVYIDLKQRAIFANTKGADLFISIHLNSFEDFSVQGTELYYYNWSEENYKIRLNRLYGTLTDTAIKSKIEQKLLASNQSRRYAENIRDSLVKYGMSVRKVIADDFAVIAYTEMPSLLVECGYISNPTFEKEIQKPEVMTRFAENIAKAIQNLF